jgi:predicted XRE-type DNA-binding protein
MKNLKDSIETFDVENVSRRFWPKVQKNLEDECWWWLATVSAGYGSMGIEPGHRTMKAHKVSYILHNGDIEKGLVIRHLCHNKLCVNPKHLKLGTYSDNAKDTALAGRQKFQKNPDLVRGENHHMNKYSKELVIAVRLLYETGNYSHKSLAEAIGVKTSWVSDVMNRTWKNI